jgi:thiol-disulfide isomerase/thioredoxin
MKKYILFLLVFSFGLLAFSIKAPSADASDIICPNGNTLASNCTASPAEPATEQLCPNGNTLMSNCTIASTGGIMPTGQYSDFANYLKKSGAVFYGTFWCPHCQAQKNLFGSSAKLLPYVECSTPDGNGQIQACTDKKITSYPTWEFADGSRLTGEQTLQQLADKTFYKFPPTLPPVHMVACSYFPCFFDGKAIANSWATVDTPPNHVSAQYPYIFYLPQKNSVQMTLRSNVWPANLDGRKNTMFVEVDNQVIFQKSKSYEQFISDEGSDNTIDVIQLGKLSAGKHSIKIYASPDSEHFMFDWFRLDPSNSATNSITVSSPYEGDSWFVGKTYRISWKPYGFTSDPFVYLSGGGHDEGYSKYIGSPVVGSNGLNNFFDYTVTKADSPEIPGGTWKVAVCNGKMAYGGDNCGWSGQIFVNSHSISQFSASCTATPIVDSDSYSIKWNGKAYGGTSPYNYSWSAYNDVSAYVGGSTISQSFTANYYSQGNKEAAFLVTDANGNTTSANCAGTIISGTQTAPYDTFAQCLKDQGAVFYGAFWAPHSQSQKNLFGSSARLLPYVECSTPDSGQTTSCEEKGIAAYPTWEFIDGTQLLGEISLQQLANKTSCVLP